MYWSFENFQSFRKFPKIPNIPPKFPVEIYRDQNSREFCNPTCALHLLLPFTHHLPQRRKLDIKLNIHRLDLSGPTSDQCVYQSWANVRCQRWAEDILLIGPCWPTGWCDVEPIYWLNIRLTFLLKLGQRQMPRLGQFTGPTSDWQVSHPGVGRITKPHCAFRYHSYRRRVQPRIGIWHWSLKCNENNFSI